MWEGNFPSLAVPLYHEEIACAQLGCGSYQALRDLIFSSKSNYNAAVLSRRPELCSHNSPDPEDRGKPNFFRLDSQQRAPNSQWPCWHDSLTHRAGGGRYTVTHRKIRIAKQSPSLIKLLGSNEPWWKDSQRHRWKQRKTPTISYSTRTWLQQLLLDLKQPGIHQGLCFHLLEEASWRSLCVYGSTSSPKLHFPFSPFQFIPFPPLLVHHYY